jgi:hypothetical protein
MKRSPRADRLAICVRWFRHETIWLALNAGMFSSELYRGFESHSLRQLLTQAVDILKDFGTSLALP